MGLFLSVMSSYAQTYYVEPTGKGFEKEISQKLDFEGIKIAQSKEVADYTLSLHYQKNNRNKKFEGYVKAVDKSGTEVYRSKVVAKAASAFNGYQAIPSVLATIIDKDLLPALKKGL